MSGRRYPIVIEQTGTGYSAYSPDVLGCAAVGDTTEETRGNFRDALVAHFEAMRELGGADSGTAHFCRLRRSRRLAIRGQNR